MKAGGSEDRTARLLQAFHMQCLTGKAEPCLMLAPAALPNTYQLLFETMHVQMGNRWRKDARREAL